ncbi:MAG: DUF2335 domain-containing protein [Alphaproteobacteria bacterium]
MTEKAEGESAPGTSIAKKTGEGEGQERSSGTGSALADEDVEVRPVESAPKSGNMGLTVSRMQMQIGPIPSPEDMNEYNQIVPGSAEKIINNMLENSRHRRDSEARQQKHNHSEEAKGRLTWVCVASALVFFLGVTIWMDQASMATRLTILLVALFSVSSVPSIFVSILKKRDIQRHQSNNESE